MVSLTTKWVQSSELSLESNDARDKHFAKPCTCYARKHCHDCLIAVTGNTLAGGSEGLPGTGLQVSPFPWSRGHPRMASLGTHQWAQQHIYGCPAPHPFRGFPLAFPLSSSLGSSCVDMGVTDYTPSWRELYTQNEL